MRRLAKERIDISGGVHIRNESHKLPGHGQRMREHEQKVHKEYFARKNCSCGICVPNEPVR